MNPSLLYDINALDYSKSLNQVPDYNHNVSKSYAVAILLMITTAVVLITFKNQENEKE
jgi:hypothetical protein